MKNFYFLRAILPLFLLLQSATLAVGQLSVTYPKPRAVFQRSNANIGYLHFGGSFSVQIDKIEARLIPVNGGDFIDWTTVVENPSGGVYKGQLLASGGWYRLELRGMREGNQVASTELNPVGIGEVFVISGQSNAKGYFNYGQLPAVDDRVNCVSETYDLEAQNLPYPTFAKINSQTVISPSGEGSWYWGELGDLLVKRLNVPVLFMNTARDAMGIRSWVNSINGGAGYNPYIKAYTGAGYPYNLLKNTLQQWVTMLGVRGVLFHQGETDNYDNVSEEEYRNGLSYLINSSRFASSKDISWVVARVSFDQFRPVWQPVIDGQTNVITSESNVFPGPNTDVITDRADGVHFSFTGLRKVAAAWNVALDDNFFARSTPYFAEPPLQPTSFCNTAGATPITLSLPENFKTYEWNTGTSDRSVEANQGGYYVGRAVDFSDKTYYSIPAIYTESLVPAAPNVTVNGDIEFCEGKTTELVANTPHTTYWSNGGQGNKLVVGKSGVYKATAVNAYGCIATSNEVAIKVDVAPKPIISPSLALDACSTEPIELKSNYSAGNQWSTGQKESAIKITGKQNVTLTVTDPEGCIASTSIAINIRKPATKPTITLVGQREFCSDTSATLTATSPDAIRWNTGQTANNLVVKSSGNYFATSRTEEGCEATSETVSIQVNPTPARPTITADGPVVICSDKKLTLIASTAEQYAWSNGEKTQNIQPKTTGRYQVKAVSAKGCISKPSDELFVQVFNKPAQPSVEQSGIYTLQTTATNASPLTSYEWYMDGKLIDRKTPTIKITNSGNYQVLIKKTYQFGVNENITCQSDLSAVYALTISGTDAGYSIYPNPLQDDALYIETLEDVDNSTIYVYDLQGRTIKTFKMSVFDSKKSFDFSDIPPGQYIVEILNNRFKAARRIIRN